MYLSAKTKQFDLRPDLYGCMLSMVTIGGEWKALEDGCKWMIDNGAFTGKFVADKWEKRLIDRIPYKENCIAVVVPDVPYDAIATRIRFYEHVDIPRKLGYKVAYATQDGQTVENTPWGDFDVLFIGGSNEHKRGIEARLLIDEAKRRGVWVHVGRVSSGWAINKYWLDCDSFDGTTFVRNNLENQEKIMKRMNPILEEIRDRNKKENQQ